MPSALLSDLYQLTMLQSYFDRGMNAVASFEFFVRKLPPHRNFLLAAGLEQALGYLEGLRFTSEEIEYLAQTGRLRPAFLRSLEDLRFSGEVWAMPEGTVFFADEPILRITAPLREAQLVESRIINLLHYQTLVASKAVRCVLAAPGKLLVDFGLRRAHGAEAGLLSARAAYLAGFSGTATVLAGQRFGIPTYGTMAHSFVQAHDDEAQAFEDFARSQPDNATLLIDTYDTEAAAHKVVALAALLHKSHIRIRAVRIDSGDLGDHARRVRAILDAGGLASVGIFASGNLDEYRLDELLRSGAPIDGFGVGTRMNTSADAPYLDCAYKLTEYAGRPRRKRSEGKATWPGRKQVFRRFSDRGEMAGDVLTVQGHQAPGEGLLEVVMRQGQRLVALPGLEAGRDHARRQVAALPERLRRLDACDQAYEVAVSAQLQVLARATDTQTAARLPGAPAKPAMLESPVPTASKVAALRQLAAYPGHPQSVQAVETHMSWVFLTDRYAFKLKKPVRYDSLDFGAVRTRQLYCQEELRLNRRLAPAVYLDVVALRMDESGALRIGDAGVVVDWLVKMRRLPAQLMLDRLLDEGSATADHLRQVAGQLAGFYRSLAPVALEPAHYIARLRREIDAFERNLCDPAFALPVDEVQRICAKLRSFLRQRPALFEARVRSGRIVEGHGDLRPEHINLGTPPAIIDCLEFSAELRTLDTADELAFLALECERLGAPPLGRVLLDTYAELTGDAPDAALVDFYQAFRACVRAKIAINHLKEAQYRDSPKWPQRARHYLELAARHAGACEAVARPGGDGTAT